MGISSGEFYEHFYKDKHLKRYFFIPNRLSSVVRELKIDRQLTSNKKSDVGNTAAHNCYQAMKALDRGPLTTELICHLHRAVMQGVTEGTVGKLRETPFFMHPNYTTNAAEYNPPLPELINDLLDDLMEFVRSNDTVDVLVKYKHFGLYFIEFLQQQTKQFPKTLILFPNLYIVYLLVLCEVV